VFKAVRPKPDGEPPIGPLKTERLRLAKTGRPGEPGPKFRLKGPLLPSEDGRLGNVPRAPGGGRRDTRMPDGKEVPVGVAGNTFTDACGERPSRDPDAEDRPDGEARDALLVLEALLWVCW
jgi:hypothetical protein